jgi:hypothetical protein
VVGETGILARGSRCRGTRMTRRHEEAAGRCEPIPRSLQPQRLRGTGIGAHPSAVRRELSPRVSVPPRLRGRRGESGVMSQESRVRSQESGGRGRRSEVGRRKPPFLHSPFPVLHPSISPSRYLTISLSRQKKWAGRPGREGLAAARASRSRRGGSASERLESHSRRP